MIKKGCLRSKRTLDKNKSQKICSLTTIGFAFVSHLHCTNFSINLFSLKRINKIQIT